MTLEQELTAMIELELAGICAQYVNRHDYPTEVWREMSVDYDAMQSMPEPDRQNAALRKLYWLATDPDDMVH